MSHLTITLVKLLGILIVSFTMLYSNYVFETLLKILFYHKNIYIIALLLLFFLPVFIGVFLFLMPKTVTSYLGIKDINIDVTYKIVDILSIAIILLGFYIVVNALVLQSIEGLNIILDKNNTSNEHKIDSIAISYIFGYILKIVIGLVFIFKGQKIANSVMID